MQKRRKLSVLALLIAIFIWLLLNLIWEQETIIHFPISIINTSDNIYIYETEAISIPIRVEGLGLNILLFYLSDYSIDYIGADLPIGNVTLNYERILAALPSRRHLRFSQVDDEINITLRTDSISQKRVPVFFEFYTSEDRDAFIRQNYIIDNHMVTISGPTLEIADINYISTEILRSDLLRSRRRIVRLQSNSEHVIVVPNIIELAQFSELIITRTLTFIPINHNTEETTIFPQRVSVQLQGSPESINQITADDIHAYIIDENISAPTELEIRFRSIANIDILDWTPRTVTTRPIMR